MQTQSYEDENHILEQLAFPGKYFLIVGLIGQSWIYM